MNKLTAKIYPGDNPKWTIAECVEVGCVTQGRDKAHALRRLKECTLGHLEMVAKDNPLIYEELGLNQSMMENLSFVVIENKP